MWDFQLHLAHQTEEILYFRESTKDSDSLIQKKKKKLSTKPASFTRGPTVLGFTVQPVLLVLTWVAVFLASL